MCMDLSKLFDMGQRASKLVHEKFDYRNVAKMTLGMYERMIDAQGYVAPAGLGDRRHFNK